MGWNGAKLSEIERNGVEWDAAWSGVEKEIDYSRFERSVKD